MKTPPTEPAAAALFDALGPRGRVRLRVLTVASVLLIVALAVGMVLQLDSAGH